MVLAILAILAGLLFPVFASARRAAQATACLSNFRSATQATLLYTTDYDDRLMPVNHRPGAENDPLHDRLWPQILLPYLSGAFRTFDCPAEPNTMTFGGTFDPDLVPGDTLPRYYDAALHSDLGYNAYYLAPVVRSGEQWLALPRTLGDMGSRTLLFVESRAAGGGSYLVAPPCRYIADHTQLSDTFLPENTQTSLSNDPLYVPILGWDVSGKQSAYPTGGVGTRHNDRTNASRLDGSARSLTLPMLSRGCQLRTGWRGSLTDPGAYLWHDVE